MSAPSGKKKLVMLIVGLAAAFGLYKFFTRPTGPEDVIIRSVIEAQALSVEEAHANDFMERIHPDYEADNFSKAADREAFGEYIKLLFARFQFDRIQTVIESNKVTLGPVADEAKVELVIHAWSIGKKKPKRGADIAPGSRKFKFTLEMKKHDGTWKIRKATQDKSVN